MENLLDPEALIAGITDLQEGDLEDKVGAFLNKAANKVGVKKQAFNKNKTCVGKADVKPLTYDEVPTGDRLTIQRQGYIDKLNCLVKKPKEALPETSLPAWYHMPMDQKLPDIPGPTGAFVWSRGNLCKPLNRKLKEYRTDDPHNRKKVIRGPYNALHDPNTENYFETPTVKEFIYNQGFINQDSNVLCSFKDFNEYRRYLFHTKYTEDLAGAKVQKHKDKTFDYEKEQLERIEESVSRTEGKIFKAEQTRLKTKEQKELVDTLREKRMKQNIKNKEFQESMFKVQLEETRARKRFEGILRDNQRDAKVSALKQHHLQVQACLVNRILQKDQQSEQYMEATRKMKEATRQEYLLVWLQHKWIAQEEKIKRDKLIDESIRVEIEKKAVKRQSNVEKYRAQLPQILVKRKAEEKRIWAIVRKYFYRWLENVRKRKARRPDDMHKSLWEIPAVFDETVKYLRKESGYEKFDDFILSIVKLKQNIRDEIEKEEAAEREELMKSQMEAPVTSSAPALA